MQGASILSLGQHLHQRESAGSIYPADCECQHKIDPVEVDHLSWGAQKVFSLMQTYTDVNKTTQWRVNFTYI